MNEERGNISPSERTWSKEVLEDVEKERQEGIQVAFQRGAGTGQA